MKYPQIILPQVYEIDDSMIILPSSNQTVEVFRGPNIGDPPKNTSMPEKLTVKVAIKVGDKITTDHIMPAGPFLKYRSNVPKYSNYVFYHIDPEFAPRCAKNKAEGLGSVIVAGLSYGQGSSREHAALCPMYLGVRVLLAKSVERIHGANLTNFGVLQLIFTDDADYDRIHDGDEITVDNIHQAIKQDIVTVRNVTQGYKFATKCTLTPRQREIVLCGGLLNFTGK
jgi:aconitate hydratase